MINLKEGMNMEPLEKLKYHRELLKNGDISCIYEYMENIFNIMIDERKRRTKEKAEDRDYHYAMIHDSIGSSDLSTKCTLLGDLAFFSNKKEPKTQNDGLNELSGYLGEKISQLNGLKCKTDENA
jgi:hypothetical protein